MNSWQMLQLRIDQSGHEHGGGAEDGCDGGLEEDGDKLSSVSHEKELLIPLSGLNHHFLYSCLNYLMYQQEF